MLEGSAAEAEPVNKSWEFQGLNSAYFQPARGAYAALRAWGEAQLAERRLALASGAAPPPPPADIKKRKRGAQLRSSLRF